MKYIPMILEIRGTLDYRIQGLIKGSKDLHIIFIKNRMNNFGMQRKTVIALAV